MADNVKYKFIQNVGDYFPSGYFSEDFIDKVQKASGLNSDQMAELCKPYVKLRGEYEKYKNYILNTNLVSRMPFAIPMISTHSCLAFWAMTPPRHTSSLLPSMRMTTPWCLYAIS